MQSNSDVDPKEDDSKVSDTSKNDYNWKLKLYLNCPITLRRKKPATIPQNSQGAKEEGDSNAEDQSDNQKKEDTNESKFYASIKDCHALVDGTYLINYNDDDGTGKSPYVHNHKHHKFKNGDFVIVKNAPCLPVFPVGEGKTVTTKK